MDWWSIAINAASLVLLVCQGVLAWGLWSLRKSFVGQEQCGERCQALADRQAALAQAQAALEQAQRALPDAAAVQRLQVQLAKIEGSVETLAATVKGQTDIMARIERPLNLLLEHHLRGDK